MTRDKSKLKNLYLKRRTKSCSLGFPLENDTMNCMETSCSLNKEVAIDKNHSSDTSYF